jgi:cytosine/adenosine deaminase-related metal-dependent hydrolase
LVKFTETNRQLSITDPRDKDLLDMSMDSLFQAHRNHNGQHNGRIHVWAAAGTPRGVPISAYQELGEECSSRAVSITMHCAEAPKDLDIYRNTYGCTPMEFIEKARMTPQKGTTSSHKLVLAHMVNLDLVKDIHLLSATGTSVAHNPSSNLKLASGIAPVPAMLSASPFPVNVALGTDGAPCANHYDMFQEMHLAAILHKGFNHDATLVPAETALEMGTINGARALGLETEIGSLETGKKADLVVLDPYGRGNIGISPWDWDDEAGVSPVTTVVHGCTGRDVHITMVDGQILVQDGVLVVGGRGQETEIVNKAKLAVKEILQRCNENRSEKIGGKLHSGWTYV